MKKTWPLPPEAETTLRHMGADLRDARRRRRLKTKILAERAGISLVTLRLIEQGNPGTSIQNYLKVIHSLGLIKNLKDIFDDPNDLVGNMLEEERLPQRIRK